MSLNTFSEFRDSRKPHLQQISPGGTSAVFFHLLFCGSMTFQVYLAGYWFVVFGVFLFFLEYLCTEILFTESKW